MQVPNIYHLLLGLPFKVESADTKTFFDCKLRRLFIHARKSALASQLDDICLEEAPVPEAQPSQEEEDEEVVEIDTDEYFGREKGAKGDSRTASTVKPETKAEPKVEEAAKEEKEPR